MTRKDSASAIGPMVDHSCERREHEIGLWETIIVIVTGTFEQWRASLPRAVDRWSRRRVEKK